MDPSTRETGDVTRPVIEIPPTEARVVLRFNTGRVPGDRLKRPSKVRDDFCHHLGREFSWKTDHECLSPECISVEPMKAYILIDFNVQTKGLDLDTIPLFYVAVAYDEAGETKYSRLNSRKVADYCRIFPWGGRE
ncbi:MAG: hypothetical protein M1823_001346 [Watsoniomyces obsoletus]|nr:MAG: hypothetical protein M1823_001346 [Watsoniomyces obsoletus]